MGIRGSGGGGGGGPRLLQFSPQALSTPESNGAPIAMIDGTSVDDYARAFDDTTEEFALGKFRVPDDIDTGGTVTFAATVMAKAAAGDEEDQVQHRFGHVAVGDDEDFDVAYSNEDSGDKHTGNTQDDIRIHTWTETVANLGWAAGDLVLFRYSRIAPSSDSLWGDLYLLHLAIEIPVS